MIECPNRTSIFPRLSLLVALIVALLRWQSVEAGADFYENPVIPGDHPDPSIIRVGRDFWATCTSGNARPIFPIFHSTDLVHWEEVGSVLPDAPAWADRDFWAPEIFERHGQYFVYYAAKSTEHRRGVGVATAAQPTGPYTDHGLIISQPDSSIDPAAAYDEHGALYLIWKEDGNGHNLPTPIWAAPLSADGLKISGPATELIRNDQAWEGPLVEGPYILRRNGWFYLFYSGNGCCGTDCHYALGMARSRSLLGPWQKDPANPILVDNARWICPGHGSIVDDGHGRYWLLHHAYREGEFYAGRQALLDEVVFGPDDWATINGGKGCALRAPAPFGGGPVAK